MSTQQGRRLLWHAFLLLLLGLITGLLLKVLHNPRLGVAAHLIGIFDGVFLAMLGLAWEHFDLSERLRGFLFWSALYGTYMGWASNLAAAVFGTSRMTPIAGAGFAGEPWQENLIMVVLITVAIALIGMCLVALWGLRNKGVIGPA
jgi:hydroxylaminobenzene mutase